MDPQGNGHSPKHTLETTALIHGALMFGTVHMTWLGWLVHGLSLQRPRLIPGHSNVDSVVGNARLWQFLTKCFGFPQNGIILPALHDHISFTYYHYITLAINVVIKQLLCFSPHSVQRGMNNSNDQNPFHQENLLTGSAVCH